MESTDLAVREERPTELVAYATDVAGACKAIVTATAKQIGQKRYVRVEGWQAIALAHGCITSSRNVQRIETGVSAIGEVRRRSDGVVLAEAEGFVGDDEEMWARRTEHARRAMAQTRAISRACRAAFAHVVVMMQAGLETTPAEEMTEHGTNGHADVPTRPLQAQAMTARTAAKAKAAAMPPLPSGDTRTITEAQQKRMFAIAKSAGHEMPVLKQWLKEICGVSHSNEITRDAYESICTRLENPTPLTGDMLGDDAPEPLPDNEPGTDG